MAVRASLRRLRALGPGRSSRALGWNGAAWRLCCALADRERVRHVPAPVLVPPTTAPLSRELCLDPLVLTDPGRLYPPPSPARPDAWETVDEAAGVERERLTFRSAAPFGIPVNDRVTVHFYRPVRARPIHHLLVLHGIWRRDQVFEDRLCRDLARAGVSCALLALPFHWERALAGSPSGAHFVAPDPVWTAAAFRQAVVDARTVLALLRGRGTPVGVAGFSLGGILAHVLMALEPVDVAVSALAGGNIAGIVWESLLTRAHRQAMEARGITRPQLAALWAAGNPTHYAWRARPGRLLMVNATYDLLVPRRFTEELWRALGAPPIHWLPAGHITAFLFRRLLAREILGAIGVHAGAVPDRRRRSGALRSMARRTRPGRRLRDTAVPG